MSDAATQSGAQSQGQQADMAGGSDAASEESSILRDLEKYVDGPENTEPDDEERDDELDDGSTDDPQARQSEDATPDAEEAKPDESKELEFVVKIDGEERKVKQADLIAGYQKGEAASKRFEEAAQVRKQAETERVHLAQALQHYTQQLQAIQQAQEPDWESLLQTDPTEYLRQQHSHNQRQAQLMQAQAAQAHLAQQQQAERMQELARLRAEQAEALMKVLPEWRDTAKAKTEIEGVRASLSKVGFNADEIEGLMDHRMVLVARKAMLYDQMAAKSSQDGQQLNQKLAKLPPPRVERPGSGEVGLTDGRTRAMKQLNSSGSLRDAASVIAHLL